MPGGGENQKLNIVRNNKEIFILLLLFLSNNSKHVCLAQHSFSCKHMYYINQACYITLLMCIQQPIFRVFIMLTCLCDEDPLKPHFYIAKLGINRGIHYLLIFAPKHRLWVLVRTATIYLLSKNKKKYHFYSL